MVKPLGTGCEGVVESWATVTLSTRDEGTSHRSAESSRETRRQGEVVLLRIYLVPRIF